MYQTGGRGVFKKQMRVSNEHDRVLIKNEL
jgi:hypothetical protein